MSAPLVLITGATGHIGFRTLVKLLEAGYRTRVSSRKLSSAEKLKDLPSIKPYAETLEFIEVPDILADGAFDSAVQGVDYILHLASPLPDDSHTGAFDVDELYVQPAIQGTVGMLKSASKSPSVKRIVITASVTVLGLQESKSTIGPDDLKPAYPKEVMATNPWIAYSGSKTLAHEAAVAYMAEHIPHYSVIHVFPAYVQGRNETVTRAQQLYDGPSSNHTMVQYVMGKHSEAPRPNYFVHVDDVAAVHVAALSSTTARNGERFIASAPPIDYKDIDAAVKKLFPKEVESGLLPLGGEQVTVSGVYDTTSTTEKLGVEFQGLEAMVNSLIGQYVELLKKEGK